MSNGKLANGMQRQQMYVSAYNPTSDIREEAVVLNVIYPYYQRGNWYRIRFIRDGSQIVVHAGNTERLLPL